MPKFDVTRQLVNIEGEGLKRQKDKELVPFDAKHAITEALLTESNQGERLRGAAKLERYRLAQRVHAATADVPLACTTEEASVIKAAVDQIWPPLIYGQIYDLVEGT